MVSTRRFSLLLDKQADGPLPNAVEEAYGHAGLWHDQVAGIDIIEVTREAPSLGAAIAEAIRDVEAIGLKPVGVAQDDEASPVVATAACLALELRALPLTAADRAAVYQLIHA